VSSLTLASGDTLLIDGAGFTLDGGGIAHNFLNYAGPVTFQDLAIVNAVASVVAGASWSLTGSDTIGSGTTLTNSGTLVDTGTLINDGSIAGTGTLGTSRAVSIANTGSLLNRGNISGPGGYSVKSGTGTLTNLGTISNTSTVGFAVHAAGGVVINGSSGATSALIDAAHFGVYNGTPARPGASSTTARSSAATFPASGCEALPAPTASPTAVRSSAALLPSAFTKSPAAARRLRSTIAVSSKVPVAAVPGSISAATAASRIPGGSAASATASGSTAATLRWSTTPARSAAAGAFLSSAPSQPAKRC
jgi:hypothetical protein